MDSPFTEDATERKKFPVYSGLMKYFPDALAAVSRVSFKGNEQHHPGTPVHWDRSKSGDELDAMLRHVVDEDWDKVAWRALAHLQKHLEKSIKDKVEKPLTATECKESIDRFRLMEASLEVSLEQLMICGDTGCGNSKEGCTHCVPHTKQSSCKVSCQGHTCVPCKPEKVEDNLMVCAKADCDKREDCPDAKPHEGDNSCSLECRGRICILHSNYKAYNEE